MDKASTDQLRFSADIVDHILEPWDIAASADEGPVSSLKDSHLVSSPVLDLDNTPPDRARSLLELGLPGDKRYVLVQLGAGVINNIDNIRESAIKSVLSLDHGYEVVVCSSPLSSPYVDNREHVHCISVYPVSSFSAAFDFQIIAAGYNSVHEAVMKSLPSIIFPNQMTSTDNQLLRARVYEKLGYGLCATDIAELEAAVVKMSQLDRRNYQTELIADNVKKIDSGYSAALAINRFLSIDLSQ